MKKKHDILQETDVLRLVKNAERGKHSEYP